MLEKLQKLFVPKERRQISILLVFSVLMGFLEIAGVASVMPIASLVINPNSELSARVLATGLSMPVLVGISFGLILAINALTLLFNWYSQRVINQHAFELSCRLLAYYLKKPFVSFLSDKGPAIGNRLLVDIKQYSSVFLTAVFNVASRLFVTACVVLFLVYLDPVMGVSLIAFLWASYWVVSSVIGKMASYYGKQRTTGESAKFKLVQDAVAGFKEIKLNQGERAFMSEFSRESKQEFDAIARGVFISTIPRSLLEVSGFLAVFSAFLAIQLFSKNPANSMAILAAYGMAGFRLLPIANQVFQGLAQIHSSKPYFDSFINEVQFYPVDYAKAFDEQPEVVSLKESIRLNHISFRYPSRSDLAIHQINIEIPKKSIIGLAGATGVGKSTVAEIACGLLSPTDGKLEIDGRELGELDAAGWMTQIGYVPQQIHLFSDTVLKNIGCWGRDAQIDQKRVTEISKMLGLHEFIVSQLPQGYETALGHGQNLLSGGQKQRLGFARAIYRDPKFLLFDEATSALDGLLEHQVLMCMKQLALEKPILLIGHRPASLQICDRIYFMENGLVRDSGTYAELYHGNKIFQTMMSIQNSL